MTVEEFLAKYVEPDRIKHLGDEMKADLEEMLKARSTGSISPNNQGLNTWLESIKAKEDWRK